MTATTSTSIPRVAANVTTATAAPVRPSDDEILGIETPLVARRGAAMSDATGFADDADDAGASRSDSDDLDAGDAGENVRAAGDDARSQPHNAAQEAAAYKEVFATPDAARQARDLVADVNRLDALFFSRRPEDHAELAKAVAELDRDAFAMLAKSMGDLAQQSAGTRATSSPAEGGKSGTPPSPANTAARGDVGGMSAAQREFMSGANAAAVESVVNEIEAQVGKLLPEGIAKAARIRVVGEIYRELDTVLRGNRALTQQLHDAFRVGRLDGDHQRSLVALISARAKQALPGVAKRVLNEWASTVVTLNQERRERQRNAERRIDIAGGGGGAGARKPMTSRDIDYRRMSDADILNL